MTIHYTAEARLDLIDGYLKELDAGWDLEYTQRVTALAIAQPLGDISTEGVDEGEIDEADMTPKEAVILGLSYFGIADKYES